MASRKRRVAQGCLGIVVVLAAIVLIFGRRFVFKRHWDVVSIATTPESSICALASFDGPITLIAGGYDKGSPFEELGMAIARKARRVILLGTTAPKIEEAVRRAAHEISRMPQILHARNLEHASELAAKDAVSGEAVLLSPACASYDMFRNFQERGELFRILARRIAAQA